MLLNNFNQTFIYSCRLLLLFFLFQSPNFSFAQKPLPAKQNSAAVWQLDATINGVQCYHQLADCDGKKVVFLKFTNKTNASVKLSWKEVFEKKYDKTLKTEGPFAEKQLKLAGGETVQADCNGVNNSNLIARPLQTTPVYEGEITKFNFKDIQVAK